LQGVIDKLQKLKNSNIAMRGCVCGTDLICEVTSSVWIVLEDQLFQSDI